MLFNHKLRPYRDSSQNVERNLEVGNSPQSFAEMLTIKKVQHSRPSCTQAPKLQGIDLECDENLEQWGQFESEDEQNLYCDENIMENSQSKDVCNLIRGVTSLACRQKPLKTGIILREFLERAETLLKGYEHSTTELKRQICDLEEENHDLRQRHRR